LRPEGLLYAVVLAPLRKGGAESSPSAAGVGGVLSRAPDILRWLVVAALPTAAWVVFRRAYYGEWLPNSYYAKRSWDFGGARYLLEWFKASPWHWGLPLAPLALVTPATRRASTTALLACAAGAAFILVARGDWMGEHRFAAHALPAAALAVGLVPLALERGVSTVAASTAGALLVAAAAAGAVAHSGARKKDPVLPLAYVAEQGRWFRAEADRLGIPHPRVAHFDIGGVALESGGEVIDLAGLADRYIASVGHSAHAQVRDYVFGVVKPDMLNVHGPCLYLREDPRMRRDYVRAATGLWGENWVRRSASE
jgi:hypothetical protein